MTAACMCMMCPLLWLLLVFAMVNITMASNRRSNSVVVVVVVVVAALIIPSTTAAAWGLSCSLSSSSSSSSQQQEQHRSSPRPCLAQKNGKKQIRCTKEEEEEEEGLRQDDDNEDNGAIGGGLLILGYGRVGTAVMMRQGRAELQFPTVWGVSRSLPAEDEGDENNEKVLRRITLADAVRVARECTHVLVTLPPPPSFFCNASDDDAAVDETNEIDDNDDNDEESANLLKRTCVAVVQNLPPAAWLGVVSTTGVYGDRDGAWVSEDDVAIHMDSLDPSAVRFRKWEEWWRRQVSSSSTRNGNDSDLSLRVFRCAGLYGPTRSALHTAFRRQQQRRNDANKSDDANNDITKSSSDGTTTTTSPKNVTNRIHEDDVARAIVASMREHTAKKWGRRDDKDDTSSTDERYDGDDDDNNNNIHFRVYNLADDLPESRRVVLAYATELLLQHHDNCMVTPRQNVEEVSEGIPPPPPDANARRLSSGSSGGGRAARRARDCKRVCNHRMKRELLQGQSLLYPTYREGLQSVLQSDEAPWWQDDDGPSQ